MRVILFNRIEQIDGGNSLTICPLMLMNAWLRADPNVSFILPVHEQMMTPTDWPLKYGVRPEDLKRIELISIPEWKIGHPHPRKMAYGLGSALFQKLGPLLPKTKYIDVAISDGVFASNAALRTSLQGTFNQGLSRIIPFVGWAEWTATETWRGKPQGLWNIFDGKAEMWGSLVCDYIAWQSTYVRDDYQKNLEKYLNPYYVSQIMRNSELIQTGIKVDDIPKKFYDGKDKPVGFWAGYVEEDYDPCCKALLKAHQSGAFSKTIICFMGSHQGRIPPQSEIDEIKSIPNVEVHMAMSQMDYLKLIAEADLFVAECDYGTYGIRFGEQAVAGMLPVISPHIAKIFMNEDWTQEFNQKEWPFIVESHSESRWTLMIIAAAKYLKEHPEVCKSVREKVGQEHDYMKSYKKMLDSTKKVVSNQMDKTAFGEFVDYAKKVTEGKEEISHHDLCEAIAPLTEAKMPLHKNALCPPGFIRWAAIQAGFDDVSYCSEEPHYKRNS